MCIEDHTKLGDGWVRQIRDQMVLVSASLRDRGAIAVLITTAFACFAAEQWSMQLRLPPHGLAPLWPFSGVAVGIVLISSGAYKIAAISGAILALAFNPSLGQSAGEGMNFIVGHALELALILLIVKRVAALPFEIQRFRDLVVLFGATLVAAALSGVVVALGLKATAFSATSLVESWWAWVASHVVGVTAIAPAIAILASGVRRWRRMSEADTAGIVGVMLLLALIYALFFRKLELASPLAIANVAILLPVMLWIAMRCRPAFSALTVFALAAAVSYDLTTGAGSSLVMPLDEYIVASQVLILFCSFSIMALALVNAERQETATALALSEQKFRAIYDRAFEFIGLLDPDGKLQDANQRALDFAGVTLSEVVGQPFCEGPWWERCEGSREKMKAAIDKGRQGLFSRFEAIHVNRRGERIIVDFSLTPIFDASGKLVNLQPEGRDITEIKRSEAALRASEALNRSTLQALPAHIAVVDGEGRIIAVNQAWTEFAAACGGHAGVGDSYLETCRRAAAIDADAALALTGIEAVLAGSSPQFAKEYPCHGPKERHWFLMTVVPLGLCNGGGAVIAHSDITARKLAEEVVARSKQKLEVQVAERTYQLEATLDAAVSAILTIDGSGTIQSVNAATVKLLGYSKNELLGQNVRILMPQPFNAEHDGYLKSYRETGTKKILGVGREVMALHKDGSTIPVHLTLSEFSAEGRQYFTGIITDLTERKAAEESLRESERRLAQSQKMHALGQLTGGLAHDINNILTVVSGNLDLALEWVEQAEARDAIRRALDAVEMGAGVNRRLLTFARRRKLEPRRLNINAEVQETMRLLARTLGEQTPLTCKLAPDLWETCVDPSEIESALLNLAINARDAMAEGGSVLIETRNITIDTAMLADQPDARPGDSVCQPGDFVCLSVTDTGMGMTSDVAQRAIEPFFTTKAPGQGTGLGLSSVYGFVEQSGGHLTINSEVGKGTTISLCLPRAPAETSAAMTSAAAKEKVPQGNGEIVLVVDDNDQVREVTLKRIESLGYAVLEAKDGPSALRLIESGENVALMLTDIVMPGGMSGYDLVRTVRKTNPSIQTLLSSGFNAHEPREGTDEGKGFKILRKPYSRVNLARALHEALNGQEPRDV